MNVKRIGLGAAAVASAATLAFAGVANATAPDRVPTKVNQLCGVVYNGTFVSNGAPATGSTGIPGVKVEGTLYDSANNPVAGGYGFDTTDPNGGYCIQGKDDMVSVVSGGGYVVVNVDASTLPAGYSLTSANPWSSGIKTSTFLAHGYNVSSFLLPDAAYRFHFTASN